MVMAVNAVLLLLLRTMYCAPGLRDPLLQVGKSRWAGVEEVCGGSSVASGISSVAKRNLFRGPIGLHQSIAEHVMLFMFGSDGWHHGNKRQLNPWANIDSIRSSVERGMSRLAMRREPRHLPYLYRILQVLESRDT